MFVDLNDKAFLKANEGDIFTIEIIHNKKFASPKTKEQLFGNELERLNLLEVENEKLRNQVKDLIAENEVFKQNVNDKINKFLSVFKGGNNNEN